MERDEIRLECLKLAAGKTADHGEAMSRAKEYVAFVTEPEEQKQTDKKHVADTKKSAK